jgi:hypothetical protein
MEQSWKQAKAVFAAALGAPLVWLVLFFLARWPSSGPTASATTRA